MLLLFSGPSLGLMMPTQSPESLPALAGEGGARDGGAQLAGAARGVLLPLPMWVSLRAHNTRRASVHASACAFTQAPEIQATRYTIWAIQTIQTQLNRRERPVQSTCVWLRSICARIFCARLTSCTVHIYCNQSKC